MIATGLISTLFNVRASWAHVTLRRLHVLKTNKGICTNCTSCNLNWSTLWTYSNLEIISYADLHPRAVIKHIEELGPNFGKWFQDVLFANHSSLSACIMVLPKLTIYHFFAPILSLFPLRWWIAVHVLWLQYDTWVSAMLAGHLLHYSFLGMLLEALKELGTVKIHHALSCDKPTF